MENRSKIAPLAIDPGHELAPDGSRDLLVTIKNAIVTIDQHTFETQSTDTGDLWELLHGIKADIEATLGLETAPSAEETADG